MKFQIGDEVEPNAGKPFKIDWIHIESGRATLYSGRGRPVYTEDELRPVEEPLKVGDWVEVIGPTYTTSSGHVVGNVFEIKTIKKFNDRIYYTTDGVPLYSDADLRKLSPEEVAMHLCYQKGKFTPEERLDSQEEYARDNDARLSAIEKRLGALPESPTESNRDPIFAISIVAGRICLNYNAEGLEIIKQFFGGP